MKIYLDSIGCRLNQSEIEKIGEEFRIAGHELVATASEADMVVVNTCSVTAKAAADSRKKIRHANRNGVDEIVVTGCWATLEPSAAALLPGVVRVISNTDKDDLVSTILDIPETEFDLEPVARQPLPGIHQRTRAFIKAQDGCNNFCTFCITRVARGESRSVPFNDILTDLSRAEKGGVKEAVLTGVHLAAWGQDLRPTSSLRQLVEMILKESDIPRIRLSSLEPWDLDEQFFMLWRDERLCPHLHIPLQSGSAKILRRMGRKITPDGFMNIVDLARSVSPNIAITTDLIVGFPGETDDDFSDSLSFVEKMGFAGGHVFTYSPRKGTPAATLPDQVLPEISRERGAKMREVIAQSAGKYRDRFVNRTERVLWESSSAYGNDGWVLHGLTGNYLHVKAYSPQILWNEFSMVRLGEHTEDGFNGEIIPDNPAFL